MRSTAVFRSLPSPSSSLFRAAIHSSSSTIPLLNSRSLLLSRSISSSPSPSINSFSSSSLSCHSFSSFPVRSFSSSSSSPHSSSSSPPTSNNNNNNNNTIDNTNNSRIGDGDNDVSVLGNAGGGGLELAANIDLLSIIEQQSTITSTSSSSASVQFSLPSSSYFSMGRLAVQYTCTVCSTRSTKTMSKLSYEKGVVLIRCDGCKKLHLFADHLNWFSDTSINIETICKEKGIMFERLIENNENNNNNSNNNNDNNNSNNQRIIDKKNEILREAEKELLKIQKDKADRRAEAEENQRRLKKEREEIQRKELEEEKKRKEKESIPTQN